MDRYTFLKNSFYVITAGTVIPKFSFQLFRNQGTHQRELDRLFANLDSSFILTKHADELGSDYLAGHKVNAFEDRLLYDHYPSRFPHLLNRKTRLPASTEIQSLIQSDFESGNTVRLQGWVLSQTEAELCALYRMTT